MTRLILKAHRHAVLGDRTDKVEDAHSIVVVTLVPERAVSEEGVGQNHERCTNNDPHKTHDLLLLLRFGGGRPTINNAMGGQIKNIIGYSG